MMRYTLMVVGVAAALGLSAGVWGQHGTGGGYEQQPGHGTMGQQAGHRFHATVEDIDQEDRTVQLRPEGSAETIKLKVPEREILSGLKKGDRVQLSLQKATGAMESPSGAGGMKSPSGSTGGTGERPGQP